MSASFSRFLRSAALAVACVVALGARPVFAVDLYQWVDTDGVLAIGPTPPPGASAVPYAPGEPQPAAPAVVTPAGPPVPPSVNARPDQIPCATFLAAEREAAKDVREAEREIEHLEARLVELDETDLMYARTECVIPEGIGPVSSCRAETFDRDKEITRSEKALERANEALSDAEQRAREATPPTRCQPASAD